VRLCDVFPDGRSRLLNFGALKGSHYASHEAPEPLDAGTVYRFEIEVWAVANVFKQGHRLRVDISTSDFPFFASNPNASKNRVHIGGEHASRVVVPVPARTIPAQPVAP
jgi:predicted acyl esterase